MSEIDVRLAAQEAIRIRKNHAMTLLLAGVSIIVLTVASILGFLLPVAVLVLLGLIFFYVQNLKEINRLVEKYG